MAVKSGTDSMNIKPEQVYQMRFSRLEAALAEKLAQAAAAGGRSTNNNDTPTGNSTLTKFSSPAESQGLKAKVEARASDLMQDKLREKTSEHEAALKTTQEEAGRQLKAVTRDIVKLEDDVKLQSKIVREKEALIERQAQTIANKDATIKKHLQMLESIEKARV